MTKMQERRKQVARRSQELAAHRKLRIARVATAIAVDRARLAEGQLIACRQMLSQALTDLATERQRADRLSVALWRADSLHLCAGEAERCHSHGVREVTVDAGEGEYA